MGIEDDPLPDYHEDPHHALTMKDVFGGIFHSNDPNYISRCKSIIIDLCKSVLLLI